MPNTPTARDKLNSAHIIAAVVIASIIGVVTGGWLAFLLAIGGGKPESRWNGSR